MAFIHKDFLLQNEPAKQLYHTYAKDMPIFDYHCHLSPKEIYDNRRFETITDVWLSGDHYKWRAMRANGIKESLITGDASSYEKFLAWAKTVPKLLGNPLYHWTHLELKTYFGIETLLNEDTALEIYEACNKKLQETDFSARELINRSHVRFIGTTDDPIDDLKYHRLIKEDESFHVAVKPTFRPDQSINLEKETFGSYLKQLEEVVGYEIDSVDTLLYALKERMNYFDEQGCLLSDHGMDFMPYRKTSLHDVNQIFHKRLKEEVLTLEELHAYKSYLLHELAKAYHDKGWVMQLHLGTMRNTNKRMYRLLGPDSGFDSMNDYPIAKELSQFLDQLEQVNAVPKTIIYTLNPRDNYVIASLIGNFQTGGIPGKVQFGSGWWFNDQKDGMLDQMSTLANVGLLSRFVGMLTDSRSFLSYTRHDYFRRTLCNMIGTWWEQGDIPQDEQLVGNMIQNICFNNAAHYFNRGDLYANDF